MRKNFSRRKFFLAGTASLFALGFINVFFGKKKATSQTARFLSQEGKLVEVQLKHVPQKKITATTEQIRNWILKN